ncbi:MAG: hypothetical protein QOF73_5120, partial [Thermomicrobiales bacterium]|nr:hypothetical protein [Thermomicrobiales bacterium]
MRTVRLSVLIAVMIAGVPAVAIRTDVKAQEASPPPGMSPASPSDPVVLAAGDIACPDSSTREPASCQDQATGDLVAAQSPTAVLALGDLQYECGKPEQFQNVFDRSWGQFKELIRPVPGNHEYNDDHGKPICPDGPQGAAGYFGYFGDAATPLDPGCQRDCRGYYSFDLGAWHLVALNSNCGEVGGCGASSPQERWLRADLAAHPAACTLAYWHHPRFSSGAGHGNEPEVRAFWRALAEAGAEVVLVGHDHDYERFAPLDAAGRPDPAG